MEPRQTPGGHEKEILQTLSAVRKLIAYRKYSDAVRMMGHKNLGFWMLRLVLLVDEIQL